MTNSGVIENEVMEVLDHVSPYHRLELKVLLHDDPEQAYIKARILKSLYWQPDIGQYSEEVEDCGV